MKVTLEFESDNPLDIVEIVNLNTIWSAITDAKPTEEYMGRFVSGLAFMLSDIHVTISDAERIRIFWSNVGYNCSDTPALIGQCELMLAGLRSSQD